MNSTTSTSKDGNRQAEHTHPTVNQANNQATGDKETLEVWIEGHGEENVQKSSSSPQNRFGTSAYICDDCGGKFRLPM